MWCQLERLNFERRQTKRVKRSTRKLLKPIHHYLVLSSVKKWYMTWDTELSVASSIIWCGNIGAAVDSQHANAKKWLYCSDFIGCYGLVMTFLDIVPKCQKQSGWIEMIEIGGGGGGGGGGEAEFSIHHLSTSNDLRPERWLSFKHTMSSQGTCQHTEKMWLPIAPTIANINTNNV